MVTKEEILNRVNQENISLIRCLYVGNDGVIRGKTTHANYLISVIDSGIGLTKAMQSFNMLDQLVSQGSFGPVGEIRLVPDLNTFTVLPYAEGNARMIADLQTLDRKPWDACPRNFLKKMIKKSEENGFRVFASFENEFYLMKKENGKFVPYDNSLCFSSIGMDSANKIVLEIIDALNKSGVDIEKYFPELGPGQQEVVMKYEDALRAADNQVAFRETVRGVAINHGLFASFAPKPFLGQAGNGCHIHISLWNTENNKNVFYDPKDQYNLSETAYNFIGGILKHIRGLIAITAPSVNSYRRLMPNTWSSAYSCYGPDNREAAIRITSNYWNREEESTNLELKFADPSCNPYLALGAIIAAGLDGIKNKIECGKPVDINPAELSEEERSSLGITRYPTSLEEALNELEKDEVLKKALGEVLHKEYIAVKRSEWRSFYNKDPELEIEKHIYVY
ncbi:MAG: glutamine synthetase family protein [Methanosarcinales archaeon]